MTACCPDPRATSAAARAAPLRLSVLGSPGQGPEMLMDLPDLDRLVATLAAALRPGGVFVFSILHPAFFGRATVGGGDRGERCQARLPAKPALTVSWRGYGSRNGFRVTGATGLEPATSGVTSRREPYKPSRSPRPRTGKPREFRASQSCLLLDLLLHDGRYWTATRACTRW